MYIYIWYKLAIHVYRNCFLWSNEIDVQVEFHNVSLGRKEVYSVFFH